LESLNIILSASITIIALGLFVVSILSFKRYKNMKLIFISSAFFVFFIKGIIQSLSIFQRDLTWIDTNPYMKLIDLVILIFLFVATLKR